MWILTPPPPMYLVYEDPTLFLKKIPIAVAVKYIYIFWMYQFFKSQYHMLLIYNDRYTMHIFLTREDNWNRIFYELLGSVWTKCKMSSNSIFPVLIMPYFIYNTCFQMSISGVNSPDSGEIAEYHLTWNNYNSSLLTFLKLFTPTQVLNTYLCLEELWINIETF